MTVAEIPHLTQAEHHRRDLHRAVDEILRAWPHALADTQARGFPPGRGYDTSPAGASTIPVHDEHRTDHGWVTDTTAPPDHVPVTGVERAALNPSVAVAWVAELADIAIELRVHRAGQDKTVWHRAAEQLADRWPGDETIRLRVYRLADMGARHWPRPARTGQVVDGVTVGRRSNDVGVCRLCGEPVLPGRGPQGRRWVQDPASGEHLEFHKSPCWYEWTRDHPGWRGAS